jgi:hypothetical protein
VTFDELLSGIFIFFLPVESITGIENSITRFFVFIKCLPVIYFRFGKFIFIIYPVTLPDEFFVGLRPCWN